ncbi:hypothetical protein HDV06_000086 [Boothiomyces sp. JEL0866]|nr:hypothetical protein HDV06_000086 [Boothiomyces sp. JEL0866]
MFGKSNTGRLSNNSSIPVPIKPMKSFTKTKEVVKKEAKPIDKPVLVDRTNREEKIQTTPLKKVTFNDTPKFSISDTPRRKELNLGTPLRIPKTPNQIKPAPTMNITPLQKNNKVVLQLGKILMENE